jgi:hypothetical protein
MAHDLNRSAYWVVILAAFATVEFASESPSLAEPDQRAALDAVIQRLRHDERLVTSAECVLTYDFQPTDDRMIPLIRAHAEKLGVNLKRYVSSKKFARAQSYVGHWWRQEVKERLDKFDSAKELSAPGAVPRSVEAFDGEVMRSYQRINNKLYGAIFPSTRWFNVDRQYPFSFLYEFQNVPYSDLLVRSQDAELTREKGQTRVRFTHPDPALPNMKFDLVFGEDNRLIRRDTIDKMQGDPAPRIYFRYTFSGYRRYPLEKGEAVWFPTQADIDYVLGTADDGTLLVSSHVRMTVDSLKFNHQLADKLFNIEFPPGCRVHDTRLHPLPGRGALRKLLGPPAPLRTP